MKFIETELPGVIVVEPAVHRDERGYFLEVYQEKNFHKGGITVKFVQDNRSQSMKGTLRGLHTQKLHPQGKLVHVVEGEIFDVAVDVRRGSPHFKKWVGVNLSADNFKMLYVPPGFAHGFCVLSEKAQVEYKCTAFYDPKDELPIIWNDSSLGIKWPVSAPLISKKDLAAKPLHELTDQLPFFNKVFS